MSKNLCPACHMPRFSRGPHAQSGCMHCEFKATHLMTPLRRCTGAAAPDPDGAGRAEAEAVYKHLLEVRSMRARGTAAFRPGRETSAD